jgi:hypothetical protein
MHIAPAHRLRRALAGALLVTALAGCSSSSDGGAATTTTRADSTTTTTAGGTGSGRDPRLDLRGPDQVTGPITGGDYGIPYLAMPPEWQDRYGYTEEEYFLSGDAVSYGVDGELAADGRWEAQGTSATKAYTTRMIVRRPKDGADFNGTLVVEWLNVSAGRESDPDFGYLAPELLAEGYAYVGVSAQRTGIEPGGLGIPIPGVPPEGLAPLKEWDPQRYGELSHPGDPWSYDIFDQATRAAIEPGKDAPLHGLRPTHLIAAGESQSASRMATYVNAIQPITKMFDGFLIHSRGASTAPLDEDAPNQPPSIVHLRTDLDVPVLQFETETDLDFLGFAKARQDDTDHLITWELAGASHVDQATLDYGIEAAQQWAKGATIDLSASCGRINEGPQQDVVQTAFHGLAAWVAGGDPPARSPRIELDAQGEIVRDADGIAVGGIRTPAVDVPISVLTGKSPSTEVICVLFGSTTPFTPEQLSARYPAHEAYVEQVTASAQQAVDDGFLLPRHAKAMVELAGLQADVP